MCLTGCQVELDAMNCSSGPAMAATAPPPAKKLQLVAAGCWRRRTLVPVYLPRCRQSQLVTTDVHVHYLVTSALLQVDLRLLLAVKHGRSCHQELCKVTSCHH